MFYGENTITQLLEIVIYFMKSKDIVIGTYYYVKFRIQMYMI